MQMCVKKAGVEGASIDRDELDGKMLLSLLLLLEGLNPLAHNYTN
jgi:hypothetical protein